MLLTFLLFYWKKYSKKPNKHNQTYHKATNLTSFNQVSFLKETEQHTNLEKQNKKPTPP